jgi:hypothetical protein
MICSRSLSGWSRSSPVLPELGVALRGQRKTWTKPRTKPVGLGKFKLADKKGALVDIGRHLGMFIDRRERSGDNGGSTALTRAELDRQAEQEIIDTFGPLLEHEPQTQEEPEE